MTTPSSENMHKSPSNRVPDSERVEKYDPIRQVLPANLRDMSFLRAVRILSKGCGSRCFTHDEHYVCVLDVGHTDLHHDGRELYWHKGTHWTSEDDRDSALIARLEDLGTSASSAELAFSCGWVAGNLAKGKS